MNHSNSATPTGNYQSTAGSPNCYFARLMSPTEVAEATDRQPQRVKDKTRGHWALCGDVSTPMFNLLTEAPAENFPVRLTGFSTSSGGNYCVFTHQVQEHQSRLVVSLQDAPVKPFLESMSQSGKLLFMLGDDRGRQSLLVDCPLKPISFVPLLTMTVAVPLSEQQDTLVELPMVMESMTNPLQVPSMLRGYSVRHVSSSLLLPKILSDEFEALLGRAIGR